MASKLERAISIPPPPRCVKCKRRGESVGIKSNGRCYHDECWAVLTYDQKKRDTRRG